MTDDRLYPPAAVYLTGALARSHRQPIVEGLEGYVWFDVPAPDGGAVMMPVPKVLLQPVVPPEPEPGAYLLDGVMAVRFATDDSVKRWAVVTPGYVGGFSWFSWETLMQRHPDPQIVPLVPAQSTVDASVVAVQQPGGGAS